MDRKKGQTLSLAPFLSIQRDGKIVSRETFLDAPIFYKENLCEN